MSLQEKLNKLKKQLEGMIEKSKLSASKTDNPTALSNSLIGDTELNLLETEIQYIQSLIIADAKAKAKEYSFGSTSKRKTPKRKTSKRKTSKRKTSKRKTSKRKTSKPKTSKRKTSKRKTSKRKTSKRKTN